MKRGRKMGTKVSAETRRRMSLAVKETWKKSNTRRDRLASIRKAARKPDVIRRKVEGIRRYWENHPERKRRGGRRIGICQSEETRRKIGIGSKKAWQNKERAAERIRKVSVTNKRLYLAGKIRLPGPNAWHKQKYKGIVMCSSWEVAFAKWCDGNKIKWRYEPKRFSIPSGSYTPDFYLPVYDFWIEIKGAMMSDPMRRFFEFKESYPENGIALLDRDLLREVGILR